MIAADCTPRHDVVSKDKVAAIAASIAANGWVGAPIVTLDAIQVTGVHRRAAWELSGKNLREMPSIDLFDICPELREEWEAICADTYDVGEYEVESILSMVPDDIAQEYGIER